MNRENSIVSDPEIMFGKPIIKGTREPVDLILNKLAGGKSLEQILKSYPHLTSDDIYACLCYAAEIVNSIVVYEVD